MSPVAAATSKTHPAKSDPVADFEGMGAIPLPQGVGFRVWAPHAESVSVMGTFNGWNETDQPLQREDNGNWSAIIEQAAVGDEYLFVIKNGDKVLKRVDPYAREVTNSAGNAIVADTAFDWQDDDFQIAPLNELVIYELHIGTFGQRKHDDLPAGFDQAARKLAHLKRLGVNCIEVMPTAEFAGDYSWGYNPAHIFAVESVYGGAKAFKRFIREAHRHGIAVILDVVYNHFGPSDLSLWQFDGWSENNRGGIYFYNDWRAATPWGETRPDYGRGEVRQYISDNAHMWCDEFHVDGLRYDMTLYIRHVSGDGDPGKSLADGWNLAQWINTDLRAKHPGKIFIAEDLQNDAGITRAADQGGAAFHTQWDAQFVHPVRAVLSEQNDEHRSIGTICAALQANYNGDPFQRVVYTESHDEVANGKSRMPSEIMPQAPDDWFAMKRSTLGAALVLTAPGVPMLFQGQEFLEDGYFQDTEPVDWDKAEDFHGIVRLFRDLIRLRLNREGATRGLTGSQIGILQADEPTKVLAYHRWHSRGPNDEVVVVANLCREPRTFSLKFPASGEWTLRLNSDSRIYSDECANTPAGNVMTDGEAASNITVGPYSVLIFSYSGNPAD